jgi:hypothetical protein
VSLRRITWAKAARATLLAAVLVLATLFVAANFVLVDVHMWGFSARMRLGWVAVLPGAVGFGAGLAYARLRQDVRDRRARPWRAR